MYLYLYDSYLTHKKYRALLSKIEIRLTDLGISGRIHRLSPLKNVHELIADEVPSRVRTVVVVGNDKTLNHVVNVVAGHNVTLGFIPIGNENNKVAASLGIGQGVAACDILSARLVLNLDLGVINDIFFLSHLNLEAGPAELDCDGSYQIKLGKGSRVVITNIRPTDLNAEGLEKYAFSPRDGRIEVVVEPSQGWTKAFKKSERPSVFSIKRLNLTSRKPTPILTDGGQLLKTPAEVHVKPKALKLIVGKNRKF